MSATSSASASVSSGITKRACVPRPNSRSALPVKTGVNTPPLSVYSTTSAQTAARSARSAPATSPPSTAAW